MSNYLIVYCHPYDKSFNHAILETIVNNLNRHHQKFKIIDLYKENFDPVYSAQELKLYHAGETVDPQVTRYLTLFRQVKGVIFVTPLWWNSIPGMLKGFIDKVMKEGKGLSHTVTKTGIYGELTNIKHTYVFTTSTSPTFYVRLFLGNGIKKIFIDKTLKQLGMKDRHWYNFGGISNSKLVRREKYLSKIKQMNFK